MFIFFKISRNLLFIFVIMKKAVESRKNSTDMWPRGFENMPLAEIINRFKQ